MKTVAISRKEGQDWEEFDTPRSYTSSMLGPGGEVHVIKFDNGVIWDAVNGFRKNSLPRVRVKMGRAIA